MNNKVRIIPLTKNTRHVDIPGVEFFQAEGLKKLEERGLNFLYLVRFRVAGKKLIFGARLDIHKRAFIDSLEHAQNTDKIERAMREMATKIALEIINSS